MSFFANIIIILIIDEPKHYQKPVTTRNPYNHLYGFMTVAELIPNASLTKAGKMSSNVYANASFFGMSTGASGTNKLFRIASLETGYISKASIMVAGQYTNPITFEIICGDGKVTKIGSPTSSYVKIYKDNNYAYIWLSASLGNYSRGGVYFNTVYASLVKFEDVTSSISVSNLTEV